MTDTTTVTEDLGILLDEGTPIIVEVQQVNCAGFGNRAVGQFRIAQGPRFVCFHIFQTEDWIHPNELNGVLSSLITGGHSFTMRTVKENVSYVEYETFRHYENSIVAVEGG